MKTMRILTFMIFTILGSTLTAQDYTKEFGIRFSGQDDVDLTFHKKTGENTYRKIRLSQVSLGGSFNNDNGNDFTSAIDLSFAREKRVPVGHKFIFTHAWEFGISAGLSSTNRIDVFNLTPYLGYTVGLKYPITNRLTAGIDIMPRIYARGQLVEGEYTSTNWGTFGLNSQNVGLSVYYTYGRVDR